VKDENERNYEYIPVNVMSVHLILSLWHCLLPCDGKVTLCYRKVCLSDITNCCGYVFSINVPR
jgi:hypothetical protein